jgi:hypothetical protein
MPTFPYGAGLCLPAGSNLYRIARRCCLPGNGALVIYGYYANELLKLVPDRRFELLTIALQGRCSTIGANPAYWCGSGDSNPKPSILEIDALTS